MQKKMLIVKDKIKAWSGKIKMSCLLIVAFIIYAYLIIVMKTIYFKMKRLDIIDELALKTQKMIHELHLLDKMVAIQTEEYDELYTDY